MKKFITVILTILTVLLGLCACAGKSSEKKELLPDSKLLGTWHYLSSQDNVYPELGGWIFNDDKTGVDTVFELTFTYETANGILHIVYDDKSCGEVDYVYLIKNSTLTMTRDVLGAETFRYKKALPEEESSADELKENPEA